MTPQKLHKLFKKCGGLSLKFRQKCIGMLPEIFREKIHEHQGMGIFEYAAKFAGLSHDQVMTVLRLDQKFQSMPALKPLLENGEVSIHKLARISSIVTDENQEELAQQVQMLSKNAVETLVRDMKNLQNSSSRESSGNQNGLQKHLFEQKFLPGQELAKLKISQNVLKKLLELQNMGINLDEFFEQALKKREQEIFAEKEQLSEQAEQTNSRYIKVPRTTLQRTSPNRSLHRHEIPPPTDGFHFS